MSSIVSNVPISNVTSLKPSALVEAMNTKSMVVFHAPWCGHCKALAPVVEELAKQRPDIKVLKINASKYGSEMRENAAAFNNIMSDVPGFPTIVFFGNGERQVHAGQRTVENLAAQYDAYQTGPAKAASPALSGGGEEYKDMSPAQVRGVEYGIVMFHWHKCGHCIRFMPAFREFQAWAAEHAAHITVGSVECPSSPEGQALAHEYGVRGFPTLKVFYDGKATDYAGARSLEALKEHAHATFFNHVEGPEGADELQGGGVISELTSRLDASIKKLQNAEESRKAKIEAERQAAAEEYKRNYHRNKKAAQEEQVPAPRLNRGAISLKASAVPDALAKDAALLLVHASWCGACVRFMPVFEQLATEFENVPFTRVEWEKHGQAIETNKVGADVIKGGLAAHVKSFPSLFVVRKGKVSRYAGARDADTLRANIAKWF